MQEDVNGGTFDAGDPGRANGNLFGMPFDWREAAVAVLPVPWEVTVSYRGGTAGAPAAVLAASPQLDFWLDDVPDAWRLAPGLAPAPGGVEAMGRELRELASSRIAWLEAGSPPALREQMVRYADAVNRGCERMTAAVQESAAALLGQGRTVAVLGGEHSTALGLLRALAACGRDFGILQLDAHMDLRDAYEGFDYSHASIMFNALKLAPVSRLVQVGVRDMSPGEVHLARSMPGRVRVFPDRALKANGFDGVCWRDQCDGIVEELPQDVYVSFDVDALDPALCPSTGTPVPGGLSFDEALFLLEHVVRSGRRIVGFDLTEAGVGSGAEWDASVAARLLFRLGVLTATSQGRTGAA